MSLHIHFTFFNKLASNWLVYKRNRAIIWVACMTELTGFIPYLQKIIIIIKETQGSCSLVDS